MNKKKDGLEIVVIFLSILLTIMVGFIVIDKIFINNNKDNKSKLLDLDKFDSYINYNNTYSSMKELGFYDEVEGMMYALNLGMDGKLYYTIFGETIYIKNIDNGVDMLFLQSKFSNINDSKWYILTDDGDVFVYSISDMLNRKDEVLKEESLKNVDRLIEFHHSASENANIIDGVIAILKNGKIKEIARSGL